MVVFKTGTLNYFFLEIKNTIIKELSIRELWLPTVEKHYIYPDHLPFVNQCAQIIQFEINLLRLMTLIKLQTTIRFQSFVHLKMLT